MLIILFHITQNWLARFQDKELCHADCVQHRGVFAVFCTIA